MRSPKLPNETPHEVRLEPIAELSNIDRVREIYEYSFPEEERRCWSSLIEERDSGNLQLWGVMLDNRMIGFVTTWDVCGVKYIEHFAIAREERNCGAGKRVIELLRKKFDKPLLLEAEPPETSAEAERRIRFYQRNGFEVADRDYIQPPYRPGLPSVPLWLMSTTGNAADASKLKNSMKEIIGELHRKVYNHQSL